MTGHDPTDRTATAHCSDDGAGDDSNGTDAGIRIVLHPT